MHQISPQNCEMITNKTVERRSGSGDLQTVFLDMVIDEQGQLKFQQVQEQQLLSLIHPQQIQDSGCNDPNTTCYFFKNEEIEKTPEIRDAAEMSVDAAHTQTVVAVEEEDILPSEDVYPYLCGLNSDNLMKFSQQSAMQELLAKENVDIDAKPNLDILPTREEHDFGGYKFELNLPLEQRGRAQSTYSRTLNKVYIRMNDILNVTAQYTPKQPIQQMRLRVLLCYAKEASEPVLRCQNHISKDTETAASKLHSLLRCENPHANYCGSADGKNIKDRFAILLPLSLGVKPHRDNSVRHSVALKFACQNSCTGRKETYLIFLLESMSGEIYAQRCLNIKVCSCPKRDCEIDERNQQPKKRKRTDDLYPRGGKLSRQDAGILRVENSSELDENAIGGGGVIGSGGGGGGGVVVGGNVGGFCEVLRTSSGDFRMKKLSPDIVLFALKGIQDGLAHRVLNGAQTREKDTQYYRRVQILYDQIQKM